MKTKETKNNKVKFSKKQLEMFFKNYIELKNLDIKLSFIPPTRYETAFGTFDVCKKTLFLNFEYFKNKNDYEIFYHLFHELRHAEQYIYSQKFSKKIRESIIYVIMYDGNCYKLVDGTWKQCLLTNNIDYKMFYMNLPYELEANKFAYKQTIKMFKKNEVKQLYKKFLPSNKIKFKKLKVLFGLIDENLN